MAAFNLNNLKHIIKVDTSVLQAKFSYFLFTARASYQAYLVLFLMNVGLSASQAGLINGLRLIGAFIGGPFWTFLADSFRCHRKLLPTVTLLAVVTMTCFPFLTFLFPKAESNYCKSNASSNANETRPKANDDYSSTNLFLVMLLASIFISFFDGSLLCFIDSATVYRCNNATPKKKYAHQRIFESFGWPFGVFVIGLFVDYFPFSDITCYAGIYIFYPVVMSLLFISNIFLLRNTNLSQQRKEKETQGNAWQTVSKMLSDPQHVLFLLSVSILGAGQGVYEGFTFPLLIDLGATTTDTTVFSVIAGVASFFAFIFGEYILKLVTDIWIIISACSFIYVIRYPIFYFVSNPDILLATSIFQIGHIIFIMAMVRHIDNNYPSNVATTFFGLANAAYYSFGYGSANIAGGIIYKKYGGETLFFGMAFGYAVWAGCILFYRFWTNKKTVFNLNHDSIKKQDNMQNKTDVSYRNEAVVMTSFGS